jgi:chemotaxis response regulator CheB
MGTIVVLGTLALNTIIITPLSDRRRQTANAKLELEAQIVEAQNMFERRRLLERKWKGLLPAGMRSDADTESRVARALNEWSRQTRLTLTSVKPERSTAEKGMNEITLVLAGRGGLEAVASFLYRVETSELPVKVTDMQLGSTSESGDNMSLQLRLSTVYPGNPTKASENSSQNQQPEANHEEQLL